MITNLIKILIRHGAAWVIQQNGSYKNMKNSYVIMISIMNHIIIFVLYKLNDPILL